MNYQFSDTLTLNQKKGILRLWNNEYPEHMAYSCLEEFENYLAKHSGKSNIIVSDSKSQIIGWYMHFLREEELWFAIIVDSTHQGKGVGYELLSLAMKEVNELNGWVIDHDNDVKTSGEAYKSPLQFYLNNGFKLIPEVRLETERISAVKIKWNKPTLN